MKKTLWIKLALLLVIPGLLFAASCAKKVVKSDESAQMTSEEIAKRAAEKASKEALEREKELAKKRAIEEEQLKESEKREAARRAEKDWFLNEDIHFEYDKSTLLPEAQEILKRKAKWLERNPGVSVTIEGHCDERGTNEYNIALGDRRAQSAKNFLVSLGIAGSRLETISYGEEKPLDPAHNETAWAKNRRAHFLIK